MEEKHQKKLTPNPSVKLQHISRRLSASLILTVTLLAAIGIATVYLRAISLEGNALQVKADEYISYITGAVEIPLWDVNTNSVQLIGRIFFQNELIVKLVIRDDTGHILFSREKDHGNHWVSRMGSVVHEGDQVGDVELWLTRKVYQAKGRSLLLSHIIGALFILICLLLVTGYFIRRFLRRPLNSLNEIVNRYAAGDYDATETQIPYHEFEPFGKVLNQMGRQINEQLKSLQKAEQKFRSIFENAVEGIYQATPEGRFLNANPALATILGYASPESLMHNVVDIKYQLYVEPSHRDELIGRFEQSDRVSGFETRMFNKDKKVIWVLMSVRAIRDTDGDLVYMEGFLTDISDRIKADEELRRHRDHLEELVAERTEALAEAKEQAEAANAAKSDFLARMSHEIRTPLNAVTGLTNVVLKSELTIDQRDFLNKVLLASKNLINVINDILDFSKVEAGQMQLVRANFDLDQVLEHLVDLFSNRTSAKDLELIFTVSPQVPRIFVGDASRLAQVLTNLIENAIKFTDEGEIIVGVDPADSVDTLAGQTALKFWVCDTGVGIGEDVLPGLFDPFTQADSSLTREHEGTGLGLAICRRLVGLMGGQIWAQSIQGQGSTFYFTVLLETKRDTKPRFTVPEDLHGLKALVVDDSATARQSLEELLKSFNFTVSTANNGEEAIEELHKAPADSPYQLVLLDWKMPGLDGIETARQINALWAEDQNTVKRSDPSMGHVSAVKEDRKPAPIIIMVTAYGHKMLKTQIDVLAMDTWLQKPVKPSQLFNTIMELFGRKEAMDRHIRSDPAPSTDHRRISGRVLVVEDSDLNRAVIVALLKDAGLEVEIAENGKIAVEKVIRLPWTHFDAVLMDVQMPLMDGYETTRRIRQWESEVQGHKLNNEESNPSKVQTETNNSIPKTTDRPPDGRLPIIALTAHALTGEEEKCLTAGMDDYLSKPIDEKKLDRVLRKWILSEKGKPAMRKPLRSREPTRVPPKLDVQGALNRLGGRRQLYDKVLKKFVAECGRAHETISRHLAADDVEAASRAAHTVKGASAAIGAEDLSRAAEDIEKKINVGQEDDLSRLLVRFSEVLNETLTVVSDYFEKETISKSDRHARNETVHQADTHVERNLERLVDFLKSGDMRAVEAWAILRRYFEGAGEVQLISDFDHAMDRLDFDGASAILKRLMKDLGQGITADGRSK